MTQDVAVFHVREIDISIVVVHWNVPGQLDTCLQSIAAEVEHSRLHVETLVIDNDSRDADWKAVAERHTQIRTIQLSSNKGYAAGANAGIRHSSGRAVLVLNPDTILHSGCLDTLWQTLMASPHIGLVAPLLVNADGTIQSSGYRFPGIFNVLFDIIPVPPRLYASTLNGRMKPAADGLPYMIDYALGAALLVRRAAFGSVKYFDESYGMYSEEIDLARRLERNGWTRLLAPSAKITHLGGQSTAQRPEAMRELLWQSRAHYHRRWTQIGRRWLIWIIVETGTRFQIRRTSTQRLSANNRIRQAFRRMLSA